MAIHASQWVTIHHIAVILDWTKVEDLPTNRLTMPSWDSQGQNDTLAFMTADCTDKIIVHKQYLLSSSENISIVQPQLIDIRTILLNRRTWFLMVRCSKRITAMFITLSQSVNWIISVLTGHFQVASCVSDHMTSLLTCSFEADETQSSFPVRNKSIKPKWQVVVTASSLAAVIMFFFSPLWLICFSQLESESPREDGR